MNNEKSAAVDGPETSGSSQSAEAVAGGEQSRAGTLSRWFWPLVCGTIFGVSLGMMMPTLWYLWLPVGWMIGLAFSTSATSSEASKPSEAAEGE